MQAAKKLEILIVAHGNWENGLAASYRRAFEAEGARVQRFDLQERRQALAPLGPIGRRLIAHLDLEGINSQANRQLVKAAMEQRPDVIVVFCNADVRPATLMQLKISVPGAKLVNIYPDPIIQMRNPVVQGLPLYDLFCTHTEVAVPLLRKLGCHAPFYLPLAADPMIHHPMALGAADTKEFGCELVYVGNWRPEHEQLFERLRDFDLAVWGSSYWQRKAAPTSYGRSRWRGRELPTGAEYVKAHRAAKIGLNPIDPMNGPAHNQRVFELPACGVFSLVSRTDDVKRLFTEGENVACFEGPDELVAKIRHYLARPEERRRIADNALRHAVEGGHTYRDRVRTLLAELGAG